MTNRFTKVTWFSNAVFFLNIYSLKIYFVKQLIALDNAIFSIFQEIWKYQNDFWLWWQIGLSTLYSLKFLKAEREKMFLNKKIWFCCYKTTVLNKVSFSNSSIDKQFSLFDSIKSPIFKIVCNKHGHTSPNLFWLWSNEVIHFLKILLV